MSNTHVVPKLINVCFGSMFNSFQFYNNTIYYQVHSVGLFEPYIVPKYWQFFLTFYSVTVYCKQILHCCLVSRFQ